MRRQLRWAVPRRGGACPGDELGDAGRALGDRTRRRSPDVHGQRRRRNPKANESFLAYFPRAITVHAGDTVVFHYVGVGEPHTVDVRHARRTTRSRPSDHLTPAQQQANTPPPAFAGGRRGAAAALPAGPGRRGPVGRESRATSRAATPGTSGLPELAARAARLRRHAVLLQQRLARREPEVDASTSRARPRPAPTASCACSIARSMAREDHGRLRRARRS